jgi:hypothetical protein
MIFLPEDVADTYRKSDIDKKTELKNGRNYPTKDGTHTYIAVKFPLYDSTGRIYAIGGISTISPKERNGRIQRV